MYQSHICPEVPMRCTRYGNACGENSMTFPFIRALPQPIQNIIRIKSETQFNQITSAETKPILFLVYDTQQQLTVALEAYCSTFGTLLVADIRDVPNLACKFRAAGGQLIRLFNRKVLRFFRGDWTIPVVNAFMKSPLQWRNFGMHPAQS